QQEAVTHSGSPLLIIAGAGSGKTRVITNRLAYLIEKGFNPQRLLAVTFTNKAAQEMLERVQKLCPQIDFLPQIGTFHRICHQFLRRYIQQIGISNNFLIYDDKEQIQAIKKIIKKYESQNSPLASALTPKYILTQISNWKNYLLLPEQVGGTWGHQQIIQELYFEYQLFLKNLNALDFDDLILYSVKILEKFPAIRSSEQDYWLDISVDEYQDTNYAQHQLVNLWTGDKQNWCIVGDFDQSIYNFRGAKIENILELSQNPQVKVIKLEQNYRSSPQILKAANQLIENNQNRLPKILWTNNAKTQEVQIHNAYDGFEEANYIVRQILAHPEYSSAVLYRTNAQSRLIEETLTRYRLSYQIIGSWRFYDRQEVRDILAYLRLIHNPLDSLAFERIINVPRRGIGEQSLIRFQNAQNQKNLNWLELIPHLNMVENLSPKIKQEFLKFYNLFRDLQYDAQILPLSQLIRSVMIKTKYQEMLEKS
ncbi:MAG TPA: UvrD-helicase domain-containing protein, partial [Candidatus Gracilibacteria bacterium]|nr:UvrD-helicase domain-containing protein [Candidatus Gracilibacteria bacterium]